MWAILGDIEFEVIASPSGAEQRFGATFVEHGRVSGKPLVEAVGGEREEIHWTILLHERVHDVDARLRAIRAATAAQQPLALVMGDGTYLGPWLIVEGALTSKKTTAAGSLVSAELQITLREYTGVFAPTLPRPGLAWGDANPAANPAINPSANPPVQPGLLTRMSQSLTAAQAVARAARAAQNTLRSASQTLQRAQGLQPAVAVAQVPGISAALGEAERSVSTLCERGSHVAEASAILHLATKLTVQLQSMRTRLSAPQPATILQQISDAGLAATQALQQFDHARGPLLALTADVAMRRR